MIKKVGELVQSGMDLKAVATSRSTENLAKELHILFSRYRRSR